MKKVSLSVIAILFAATSVFANGHGPVVKKAKHAVCHTCAKGHCTKTASCPNQKDCVCK